MKIAQVVYALNRADGVAVFVRNISHELLAAGHDVQIITAEDGKVDYGQFDVVHIHALWMPWLHHQAKRARACRVPIVWSPHGMLAPWAMHNHWWKKWPIWHLCQKADLRRAAALHVTARTEEKDARALKLMNPVIIAPLGVDLCSETCRSREVKVLLFVGRIHPIKNLPMLIAAFSHVRVDGWKLRVVGPDQEGHLAELKRMARERGVDKLIEFAGPKYGDELKQEYVNSDCFVLPSHSENFGSVVVEALSVGVPVIASQGTPWQELEEYDCGKWVKTDEVTMENALIEMMTKSDWEREMMGRRGRQLVKEKYTWTAVANKILDGYREVMNVGK